MKNLVQQLMNDRPDEWADVLERDLKIKIVRDGNLASLKYDQIESPMHEPIVQQCRGMVVDTAMREVLAWPYNKFWNHGEHLAAPIEWATARVQEKLDGSLMILYWFAGDWRVASSGHPTAGGSFGAESYTFREAFWRFATDLGVKVFGLEPTVTYMLELCHTPNRVVVRHDRPRLVLHGARDMILGRELSRVELEIFARDAHCELVREFPIYSIEACLAAAETLDPIQHEGFVVVDAKFNRVKIKSPRYVILHHMKGEATPRRAIELWQTGEAAELLTHFPEMASVIEPVQAELDNIADQAAQDYGENMPRASRKEFALAIKDRPWSSVLFKMLDSKRKDADAARSIMRRMTTAALERMVIK